MDTASRLFDRSYHITTSCVITPHKVLLVANLPVDNRPDKSALIVAAIPVSLVMSLSIDCRSTFLCRSTKIYGADLLVDTKTSADKSDWLTKRLI